MGFYDHNPSAYAKSYTPGYRIGVGVAAVTGLCSAVSTLLLLSYIAYYTLFTRENSPMARGIRAFAKSALGVYLCSLLFSDMLHGVAFSISLKWVSDGGIRHSAACTVQGGIFQVGALGGALWSLAIACHTFSLLFVIKKPPTWTTRVVLGLVWIVLIVPAIIGPQAIENVEKSGYFYGFIGAWCWIGPGYRLQWYLFYYIWVFLTLLSSTVMYGFVYLRLFGLLSYENGKLVWKKSGHGRGLNCLSSSWSAHDTTSPSHPSEPGSSASRPHNIADPNRVGKHLKGIARRLMLYPLAYSMVMLPLVILRLGLTAGWKPPPAYQIFAGVVFASAGLVNVLLFIVTRHSFIRQAAATRPQVHVSTQQVAVSEDARGVQAIHLHELCSARGREDQDGSSEKVDLEGDGSIEMKRGD